MSSYTPEELVAGDAMRQAHAFCPTDMPHLERMRWMGKFVYDKIAATLRQQAAQAVDVVAWRWRDNVRPGLPWKTTTDAEVIAQMQASGGYEIEPLTRALSGEKAGGTEDNSAAVAAIQFALHGEDGMAFLRYWNEGEFDVCRRNWPEAPAACYVGADPLTPPTDGEE